MLTKEILCAYAPFGVKFQAKGEIWIMTSFKELYEYPIWADTIWNSKKKKYVPELNNRDNCVGHGFKYNEVQLLLCPLSNLMKQTDDGYSYLIGKIVGRCEQFCDAYDEWLAIFIDDPNPSRIFQAPYEVVQELLKEKFDIFGLIESGHAIELKEVTEESKYTESKGE